VSTYRVVVRWGGAGRVPGPPGRGPACAWWGGGALLGLGSGERRDGMEVEPVLRALAFNAPGREAP